MDTLILKYNTVSFYTLIMVFIFINKLVYNNICCLILIKNNYLCTWNILNLCIGIYVLNQKKYSLILVCIWCCARLALSSKVPLQKHLGFYLITV